MKIKQTAGKEGLGDFAKQFADLNDDVLFGEVWSNEDLSLKMRSILTISALVSKGLMDTSFQYHLQSYACKRKNDGFSVELGIQ